MLPMDVLDAINVKAKDYYIPAGNLAAIVEVESNGRVYATVGGSRMPVILFEPHILYRRTDGPARDELVRLGLASARQNSRLYPATQTARWQQIRDAAEVLVRHGHPAVAAFESASYGVGQVMGYHWQSLGYASFDEFYERMLTGVDGQIEIMLQYIVANYLDDELREGRWPAFFRGYNGPDWERLGYGRKVEEALVRYGGSSSQPNGMLHIGSKGQRVRELQSLLVRAGYQVTVDGDFGPATRDTVLAFQQANGLTVDGVYGPQTESALSTYRQSSEENPGQQAISEIREVKEGVGGVGVGIGIEMAKGAVDKATEQLQQVSGLSPIIDYALVGLSVAAAVVAIAGLAWAVKGLIDSRRTQEV